ncbi:MAG: hypothetical protein ACYS47_13875 [Planctomycetota bacterium]
MGRIAVIVLLLLGALAFVVAEPVLAQCPGGGCGGGGCGGGGGKAAGGGGGCPSGGGGCPSGRGVPSCGAACAQNYGGNIEWIESLGQSTPKITGGMRSTSFGRHATS